jgi:transcriptional regulator with XRE-family HTH domain
MAMNQSAGFGAALRTLRSQLGLSQEAVAHMLGTTQRHVSFLETGRSSLTREMLGRIVAGLPLTAAQRAALFEASGFRNPYPTRTLDSIDLQATLDLMERQVLSHWPFPAFVVDRDWNFLRTNRPAQRMIVSFGGVTNMYALFMAPEFRGLVTNWLEASGSFYTRIQEVATRSPIVQAALEDAVAEGHFDHVAEALAGTELLPVHVPIEAQLPDGSRMRFTSLHGRWISVHDTLAEQFEVELLVPLDAASERVVATAFAEVDA